MNYLKIRFKRIKKEMQSGSQENLLDPVGSGDLTLCIFLT